MNDFLNVWEVELAWVVTTAGHESGWLLNPGCVLSDDSVWVGPVRPKDFLIFKDAIEDLNSRHALQTDAWVVENSEFDAEPCNRFLYDFQTRLLWVSILVSGLKVEKDGTLGSRRTTLMEFHADRDEFDNRRCLNVRHELHQVAFLLINDHITLICIIKFFLCDLFVLEVTKILRPMPLRQVINLARPLFILNRL